MRVKKLNLKFIFPGVSYYLTGFQTSIDAVVHHGVRSDNTNVLNNTSDPSVSDEEVKNAIQPSSFEIFENTIKTSSSQAEETVLKLDRATCLDHGACSLALNNDDAINKPEEDDNSTSSSYNSPEKNGDTSGNNVVAGGNDAVAGTVQQNPGEAVFDTELVPSSIAEPVNSCGRGKSGRSKTDTQSVTFLEGNPCERLLRGRASTSSEKTKNETSPAMISISAPTPTGKSLSWGAWIWKWLPPFVLVVLLHVFAGAILYSYIHLLHFNCDVCCLNSDTKDLLDTVFFKLSDENEYKTSLPPLCQYCVNCCYFLRWLGAFVSCCGDCQSCVDSCTRCCTKCRKYCHDLDFNYVPSRFLSFSCGYECLYGAWSDLEWCYPQNMNYCMGFYCLKWVFCRQICMSYHVGDYYGMFCGFGAFMTTGVLRKPRLYHEWAKQEISKSMIPVPCVNPLIPVCLLPCPHLCVLGIFDLIKQSENEPKNCDRIKGLFCQDIVKNAKSVFKTNAAFHLIPASPVIGCPLAVGGLLYQIACTGLQQNQKHCFVFTVLEAEDFVPCWMGCYYSVFMACGPTLSYVRMVTNWFPDKDKTPS